MWVLCLSQEDPLEKEMETCSSILAWEIPWTEEPGSLQSMELQRVGYDLLNKQQQHVQLGCTPKACKPDSFPVLRLNKDLKHSSREINNLLVRRSYKSEAKSWSDTPSLWLQEGIFATKGRRRLTFIGEIDIKLAH